MEIIDKIIHTKFGRLIPDKIFLKLLFKIRYNKKLNLKNPQTYNEKIQWLKLYDRRDNYTNIVDKVEVKKYVASIIGDEHIIKTIGVYNKWDDIDFSKLPNKFVIKCTHDSGGLIVCRDKKKLDYEKAKIKIENCLKKNYYHSAREWPYKNVKPRILIEEYLSVDQHKGKNGKISSLEKIQLKNGLLDYKFMCFDGEVKALFLDIGVIGSGVGHAEEYYRNVYDKNFNLMPFLETRQNYPEKVYKPDHYEEMVKIAEKLSKGFPHIRVDLYNINGKIYFGELTFYHGSGLSNKFIPEEWNKTFGSYINLDKIKNKL